MKRMDDDASPEETDAEVDAALSRVGAAFDRAYRRDALKAKRSAVRLLLMTLFALLFIHGMPLHFLFYPWGQIALVLWVPVGGWALMDCCIFVTKWFDRRTSPVETGDR
jgi:hypothetical protein